MPVRYVTLPATRGLRTIGTPYRDEAMQTSRARIRIVPRAEAVMAEPHALPLLKWAGGKRGLLEALLRSVPRDYGTLYEPFAGGATLLLHLGPASGVLADANQHLIELYETARDRPDELMAALDALQPRVLDQTFYYEQRAQQPDGLDPVQRAARLIFLNKTCYNGLYRENRRGEFNVPFGRYAHAPALYNRANLSAVAAALRGTRLLCADFEAAVADARAGDFIYFDPPYVPLTSTASFTRYTRASFGPADQRRLARVFADLAGRGCRVLLSNSDMPEVRELYAGFHVAEVQAGRNINSKPSGRAQIGELLISTHPPAQAG